MGASALAVLCDLMCTFVPRQAKTDHIREESGESGEGAREELTSLEELLCNPKLLQERSKCLFLRHAVGAQLTADSLASVLHDMQKEIQLLRAPWLSHDALVEATVCKLQRDSLGYLTEEDVEEMYRWNVWQRYEELNKPLFTRHDIVSCTFRSDPHDRYEIQEELGRGEFGVVQRVVQKGTLLERCMKSSTTQKGSLEEFRGEVKVLAMLDHPHVLRLFEVFIHEKEVFVLTGICRGGSVWDALCEHRASEGYPPEIWVVHVFTQILRAVAYLHAKGVMHKDLKFDNVMLRNKVTCQSHVNDIDVVIIDVGISELFGAQHGLDERSCRFGGTFATMAPGVLRLSASEKCDIWSIGCMLFAIYNSDPQMVSDMNGELVPFPYPFVPAPAEGDPYGVKALRARQKEGPPMVKISSASSAMQDNIRRMLVWNEDQRPSAQECLRLHLFSAVRSDLTFTEAELQALRESAEHRDRFWWLLLKSVAATQLPQELFAHHRHMFNSMDTDLDGVVKINDFSLMIQRSGVAAEEADFMARATDLAGNGVLTWSEFVAALIPADADLLETATNLVFHEMDVNHSGEITLVQLVALLGVGIRRCCLHPFQLPDGLLHLYADRLLSEMTGSHGRGVSAGDFSRWFTHRNPAR